MLVKRHILTHPTGSILCLAGLENAWRIREKGREVCLDWQEKSFACVFDV